jgi:hypothetical protein
MAGMPTLGELPGQQNLYREYGANLPDPPLVFRNVWAKIVGDSRISHDRLMKDCLEFDMGRAVTPFAARHKQFDLCSIWLTCQRKLRRRFRAKSAVFTVHGGEFINESTYSLTYPRAYYRCVAHDA